MLFKTKMRIREQPWRAIPGIRLHLVELVNERGGLGMQMTRMGIGSGTAGVVGI